MYVAAKFHSSTSIGRWVVAICASRTSSIITKQWTLSVTWPFVYLAPLWRYGASKIIASWLWSFGVTWHHQSRDHSAHGGPLHCDHASVLHLYGDTKPQMLDARMDRCSGDFILCPVLLHWTDNKPHFFEMPATADYTVQLMFCHCRCSLMT